MRLSAELASGLVEELDRVLQREACDHSFRLSKKWAQRNRIDCEELEAVLEGNNCYCDCEVALNLRTDVDLVFEPRVEIIPEDNPWRVPSGYDCANEKQVYSQLAIAVGQDVPFCFAKKGEMIVPAPKGGKARRKMRRLIHFFVGLETGLPCEIGAVSRAQPFTVSELVKRVRESQLPELSKFGEREAGFYLGLLAKLEENTIVGVDIMQIIGISRSYEELRLVKLPPRVANLPPRRK